jgi:hypothetical protein
LFAFGEILDILKSDSPFSCLKGKTKSSKTLEELPDNNSLYYLLHNKLGTDSIKPKFDTIIPILSENKQSIFLQV